MAGEGAARKKRSLKEASLVTVRKTEEDASQVSAEAFTDSDASEAGERERRAQSKMSLVFSASSCW